MDKLLFRRILMIALSVLAVVYAAYLLISTNFKMYPTENAVQTTVTDKIYSNGFIIRDENMIQNNTYVAGRACFLKCLQIGKLFL